jgi:hypothetical protein
MNVRDSEFDQLLAEWLEDDPIVAPAAPVEAAVEFARIHPQRGDWLAWLRRDAMTTRAAPRLRPVAVLVAIVALMVLVVGGAVLMGSEPDTTPTPASSPSASPSAGESASPSPSVQGAAIDLARVKRVFTDACVDPGVNGSTDPLRFDGLFCGQVDIQGMTAEGTTLVVPTLVAVNDLEQRTRIICEQIDAAHVDLANNELLGFDTIRVLDRRGDVDMVCGTAVPPEVGLVAFIQVEELQPGEGQCTADSLPGSCSAHRIWLAGADGSNPHRLPSTVDRDTPLAWTPDGAGLLVQTSLGGGLVVMDPNGAVTRELAHDDLCALPCAGADGFDFSPDGTRLAFVRRYPEVDNATVIAVVDMATGEVTELDATRTTNTSVDECFRIAGCQGLDGTPRWSHDGSRLVFGRQAMSPEAGSQGTSAAVYTINGDGTGLRRVTPEGLFAVDPRWSPDDETLLFTKVDLAGPGQRTFIYSIRHDGNGLRQLTDDADSSMAAWTLDRHVTFARSTFGSTYGNWIMDTDGGHPTQLGSTLAELTAAGCTSCLYPVPTRDLSGAASALWQPTH